MTPEQTSNSADATEPARYVIDEASVLGRNRRILLATLVQAGAVTATANYVGCGDSGGVEDVSVEMPAEAPFDMAALVTVFAERGVFENGEWQTTIVEQTHQPQGGGLLGRQPPQKENPMNTTENTDVPDYRVDASGAITVTEAGLAIDRAYREAERAFDTLQHCWAGACLAGLFVRHPWLQALRATLSASAEYDDQGGTYRSISNAVTQVVPVAGATLPDSVIDEGTFDELGAIAVIEADLDECDLNLYSSIHTAPDDYADLLLELSRTAIEPLMNGAAISGAEAYRAWFPEQPASPAVA